MTPSCVGDLDQFPHTETTSENIYNSIESYFAKFNEYTTLSARQMYANGRHFHLLAVLARLPLEFFKRYILKLGLLDGMRGFLWATFSTYYVLVKYMKLWALQQQNK